MGLSYRNLFSIRHLSHQSHRETALHLSSLLVTTSIISPSCLLSLPSTQQATTTHFSQLLTLFLLKQQKQILKKHILKFSPSVTKLPILLAATAFQKALLYQTRSYTWGHILSQAKIKTSPSPSALPFSLETFTQQRKQNLAIQSSSQATPRWVHRGLCRQSAVKQMLRDREDTNEEIYKEAKQKPNQQGTKAVCKRKHFRSTAEQKENWTDRVSPRAHKSWKHFSMLNW